MRQPFGVCSRRILDVFEVARVPQRIEIALQRRRVVNVAGLGEDSRQNRLFGDSSVAGDLNVGNDVGLRPGQARRRQQERWPSTSAILPRSASSSAKAVEMKEMAPTRPRERKGRLGTTRFSE